MNPQVFLVQSAFSHGFPTVNERPAPPSSAPRSPGIAMEIVQLEVQWQLAFLGDFTVKKHGDFTYRMVPPSYKLVYKPHEYYSYICHKP